MERLIAFLVLSILLIVISWRTLFDIRSHGFYRFFSWECIIWLFVTNYKFWYIDPLGMKQILSWIFLFWSAYLVIAGALLLKYRGKPLQNRKENTLYQFEKTSELVDRGIFRYIRHPLYSSLLFLTWGIFLKNTSFPLLIVAVLSTGFLYLTAIYDEKECIRFFGEKYCAYMKRSKRFIPYII